MSDPSATPALLSVRLTAEERSRLAREASGLSLSAYARWRLFDSTSPPPRTRGKAPVKDQAALARVLALLGQSRIASNLNQLARAAHTGALPIEDELARDLREAVDHIAAIRRALIDALGLTDTPATNGS